MKKLSYLFFACLLVLSVSCKDDEDNNPNTVLGTWEDSNEEENEGEDYYAVETFIFKADGTYENSVTGRDSESGEVTCYYRMSSGTYTRSGDKLILDGSGYAHLYHPSGCGTMEELVDYDPAEPVEPREITFEITNQGTELTLDYGPCNDVCPPNAFCICIGPQTFIKVD
ncbi:hypothetical protein DN752_10975 [Echinicola strongylocentroti]|uniref:Lipocalin-like domain-containing protein n=1 Tax=Echinicola strongylocentroti TaxID=1795355 RepID=A0A2Z4IHK5_9BACT|nr:hypothetical protein [Echinicola strongylocentroti]AWW30602.1 hypothetical protein DN752_10975 [Echinicola strongylocentroti]